MWLCLWWLCLWWLCLVAVAVVMAIVVVVVVVVVVVAAAAVVWRVGVHARAFICVRCFVGRWPAGRPNARAVTWSRGTWRAR